MSKVAIITARAGSKRIPNKNIINFLGKPLISYAIQNAIDSDVFDEVMVSTDSKDIAQLALEHGAVVPFMRGVENAGDFSTTSDVIEEVLAEYEKLGKKFDFACCIYPTSVLVEPAYIKECLEILMNSKCDAVIPVVRYSMPIERALIINGKKLKMKYPDYERVRTQDIDPCYHDAGQFYWINVDSFKMQRKLFMNDVSPYVLEETSVQDIDEFVDLEMAEIKYRQKFLIR